MAGLLQGIRVVENASVIAGPLAGVLLADLGADVIKVELPEGGDQFRHWVGNDEAVSAWFANYNRGKQSISLNLRSDEGCTIYKKLVENADVVIENYRAGAMDARGIGYEALKELNPRLIYCEITGLGASGPYANRPTFDAVAQAISGLWSNLIDLENPEAVGPPMSDQLTGTYAALAILAAVISRASTDKGTKVSLNMLSSSMSFISGSFASYLKDKEVPTKTSRGRGSQSYAFSDSAGKPFAVHLSTPKKFWDGLCRTVGHPEMADAEAYNTKAKRIQAFDEIHAIFSRVFATGDRESWIEALIAEDVPCAPILTVDEVLDDPQVRHLEMLWRDPVSQCLLVRAPIQHEGRFVAAERAAPFLGENTVELLSDLGYGQADIERLRSAKVV